MHRILVFFGDLAGNARVTDLRNHGMVFKN